MSVNYAIHVDIANVTKALQRALEGDQDALGERGLSHVSQNSALLARRYAEIAVHELLKLEIFAEDLVKSNGTEPAANRDLDAFDKLLENKRALDLAGGLPPAKHVDHVRR